MKLLKKGAKVLSANERLWSIINGHQSLWVLSNWHIVITSSTPFFLTPNNKDNQVKSYILLKQLNKSPTQFESILHDLAQFLVTSRKTQRQ